MWSSIGVRDQFRGPALQVLQMHREAMQRNWTLSPIEPGQQVGCRAPPDASPHARTKKKDTGLRLKAAMTSPPRPNPLNPHHRRRALERAHRVLEMRLVAHGD